MVNRTKCDKCNVRIPKNRPQLKCSICNTIKHFKCNGLTKNEAFEIIKNQPLWSCSDCISNILPLNLVLEIKNKPEKCEACFKNIGPSMVVAKCPWCNVRCHKNCINGNLGCNLCCNNIIPGFNYFAHNLFGETYFDSRPIFNPWDQDHLINQLGLSSNLDAEEVVNNDTSSKLSQCKYSMLKNLPTCSNGNPRILSLNIRSLFKGIDKLREDIFILQEKCDLLCLCETNLKEDRLPNGLADITLEGFHEPIFKEPHRKSGKGGGLAIYVNKSFCDSDAITELEFLNTAINPEPDPPGEFLFVKIGLKIQKTNNKAYATKNIVIGNIYRSPSSNHAKFIKHLECHLCILDRHKNNITYIVGDFNVDLSKYDTDLHCHDLINQMAEHNFAQVISLPTRITDHTATIIDHVYSNQVHTLLTSRVVTLDISDHLGTYVQFSVDPQYLLQNSTEKHDPLTEFINFRKFNTVNMDKFAKLIGGETWGAVDDVSSAEKNTKILNIFILNITTNHLNQNQYDAKIKEKIQNLGFSHGLKMPVVVKIKLIMKK